MKLLPECVAVGVGAAVAASTVAAAEWSPRAQEAINPIQSGYLFFIGYVIEKIRDLMYGLYL